MACKNCKEKDKEIQRLRDWHRVRNSYIDHPAGDFTKWRAYDRMPIQIHRGVVIMLTVFEESGGHLEDIWLDEHIDIQRRKYGDENNKSIYQRAADQFEKQLEGHHCIAFWKALRDKADQLIKEHEDRVKQKS